MKSYKWQSLSIYKHILSLPFSVFPQTSNNKCTCHGMRTFVTWQWYVRLECVSTVKQKTQILSDVTLCHWMCYSQHHKNLLYLQNMTNSHPSSQSTSDPRRPDVSWQWHVLTSRRTKNIWSNTISMVRVGKISAFERRLWMRFPSDLWSESNFVYSDSLTLSFTRPITHTLIRSLMCSGITSFGPIEMWLLSTRSNNFYPKHLFNIFTYRNLKLYRYL